MRTSLENIDFGLLNDWQRGFPVTTRPFKEIGNKIGVDEALIIERYKALNKLGAISRIGAAIRPNTIGASTLAAVACPPFQVEEVAQIINLEPGVNHSYLREDEWNMWFVVTGHDRGEVNDTIERIAKATSLRVLNLPLVKAFNIDLGFSLNGEHGKPLAKKQVDLSIIQDQDHEIIHGLSSGLSIVEHPFADLGNKLRLDEHNILQRIKKLDEAGIFSRLGVIVRHRALGWCANVMIVWQVPQTHVERIGNQLARLQGITLCYSRQAVPEVWPYTLYCMVHAKSRQQALQVLEQAKQIQGLGNIAYKTLFSVRCFKQKGAVLIPAKRRAK